MIRWVRRLITWLVVIQAVAALAVRVAVLLLPDRGEEGSAEFERNAIGGGVRFDARSSSWRRGLVRAVLGGATVDLRGATPVEGGAVLTLLVALGGVEVVVPPDWSVILTRRGFAGDVLAPSESTADSGPVLSVRAAVYLGGVAIERQPVSAGAAGELPR